MILYRTEVLEAIYANVSLLIADLQTGEILDISPTCEKLFGYQVTRELIGQNVDMLVPRGVREAHMRHRADFNSNPMPRAMGVTFKLEGQRKDGSLFPLRISLSPAMVGTRRCVIAVIMQM